MSTRLSTAQAAGDASSACAHVQAHHKPLVVRERAGRLPPLSASFAWLQQSRQHDRQTAASSSARGEGNNIRSNKSGTHTGGTRARSQLAGSQASRPVCPLGAEQTWFRQLFVIHHQGMLVVGPSSTQTKLWVRGQRDKAAHTQAGTVALSCTSQQLPHNSSAHTHSWSLLCSACIHTYRNETLSRKAPCCWIKAIKEHRACSVGTTPSHARAHAKQTHKETATCARSIPQRPCPTPAQTIALHLPVPKQQHALWHWQRTKHNHRGVLSTHMPWPQPTTQAKASKQAGYIYMHQHGANRDRDSQQHLNFLAHPTGRPQGGCVCRDNGIGLWGSPPQ